jgi:peptidoglycan hydrolase-like protein with peptidoglycan-binding domain
MGRERTKARWLIVPIILLVIVSIYMAGRSTSLKSDPLENQLSALSMPTAFAQAKAEAPRVFVEPVSAIARSTIAPTSTQASSSAHQLTIAELEQISGIEYKKGSSGAAVRQLQKWLITLQYLPENENDGTFGIKTVTAVRAFQEVEGLTVDGVATVATQYILASQAATFSRTEKGALLAGTDSFSIVKWDDSSFYIGSILDNHPNGKGTFYFAQGGYFVGSFIDGLREGKGEMHFANGDYYTGNWRGDQMEGKGVYYFGGSDSIEQYSGEWAGSMMDGKGTYTLPDGRKIKGNWSNNEYVS